MLRDKPLAFYRLDDGQGSVMANAASPGRAGVYAATGVVHCITGPFVGDHGVYLPENSDGIGTGATGPTGDSSFTMETWFDSDGLRQNEALVALAGPSETGLAVWTSPLVRAYSALGLDEYGTSNIWATDRLGINLWDGRWHYLAITYSAATNSVTGYVDGHDLGSQLAVRHPLDQVASPMLLGNWVDHIVNAPFAGEAADIAVYSAALSPAQIAAHYRARGTPSPIVSVTTTSSTTVATTTTTSTTTTTTAPPPTTSSTTAPPIVVPHGAGQCSPSGPNAYDRSVLADKPWEFYRLDDGPGTLMADSGPGHRDGTYATTGVVHCVPGPFSGDDAVYVPAGQGGIGQGALAPVGNNSFSLEAWFNSTGLTQSEAIVSLPAANETGMAVWTNPLGIPGATNLALDQQGVYNYFPTTRAHVNLWDSRWHYLVITYVAGTNDVTAYVDGHDLGTQPSARSGITTVASPVLLGNWVDHFVNSVFAGEAADIAVYDHALTPARVAAHWAAAGGAPSSDESSLASSLLPPGAAFSPITSDVVNAGVALAAALFITFPANLFNSTFKENYEAIAAWWAKWLLRLFPERLRRTARRARVRVAGTIDRLPHRPAPLGTAKLAGAAAAGAPEVPPGNEGLTTATVGAGPPTAEPVTAQALTVEGSPAGDAAAAAVTPSEGSDGAQGSRHTRHVGGFVVVVLIGALLGALLDPAFGPNVRTLIGYMAIVLAIVAGVTVSGLVTGGYHRLRHHEDTSFDFEVLPLGLGVAAFCVIVSRSTNFTPGYLYGVIAGIAFARELRNEEEGHVAALGALANIVVALTAWGLWAVVNPYASHKGSFLGTVLVADFLGSIFVSNLVGTVISLLPLRFLPGHKLKSWHRGAWAGTFGLALFLLVQVLLRPRSGGPSHAPLLTIVGLFVLFGGGSVLFRYHFSRKHAHAVAGGGEVQVNSAAEPAQPAEPTA